jgi:hypothetical protein
MKKACLRNITLHVSIRCYDLNLPEKTIQIPEFVKDDHKKFAYWRNDAKLATRASKSSTLEMKMLIDFIRRGISVYIVFIPMQ